MEIEYPIEAFSIQFGGTPPNKPDQLSILPGGQTIWDDLIMPALTLALLHGFYDGTEYRIVHHGEKCGTCTFTLHLQTADSPRRLEVRVSITPVKGTEKRFTTFLEVLCFGLLSWDKETGHKIEIRLTPGHDGFVSVNDGVNKLIELIP